MTDYPRRHYHFCKTCDGYFKCEVANCDCPAVSAWCPICIDPFYTSHDIKQVSDRLDE